MPFFGNPSSGGSASSPGPLWRTRPFGSFTNSYVFLQEPSWAEEENISAVNVSGCFLPGCAKGRGRKGTLSFRSRRPLSVAPEVPARHRPSARAAGAPDFTLTRGHAAAAFPPAPACTVGGQTWRRGSGNSDGRQTQQRDGGTRPNCPTCGPHTPDDAPTAPRTHGRPPR